MKELAIIFIALFFLPVAGPAQAAGSNNWLSFILQAEARPGGNSAWDRVQRLEVSKRAGAPAGQENTAGAIRLDPEDKEVRFTFSNFTLNGAWFSPGEVVVEYEEEGRKIGPIRALPGPGNSGYYQMTLRFREKTSRSLFSVRLSGRASSGQFVKDTINTLLLWGGGPVQAADVQVSYLDETSRDLAVRSPYAGAPASYGATQGRVDDGSENYAIQLGAYDILPDSRQFSMAATFGTVYSRRIGNRYYVRVGPYNNPVSAKQYLERIRASFPEAYIVMEDNTVPLSGNPPTGASPYGQPAQYGALATPRLPVESSQAAIGAASYALPAGITGYAIQLASLTNEENAISFVNRLRQRGISDVYIWKKDGNNRVVIAPFPNKGDAERYLETLKQQYAQQGIVAYIK
ncbi:MAG: SPOR domain-containing protein [Phaeodactylibacter sp.]|nr:SPOR domain-containing protein [Phaeodactylibacter sp.]